MKNLKAFIHILLPRLFLLVFITGVVYMLCSCEKEENFGTPTITNIRITDPDKADSSLTAADMGQMIVIQGTNLASVQHIFFNDVEAFFLPTYATNSNIIVTIPSEFPTELTNQITVITKGGTATYDFTVDIPKPVITSLSAEYAADGDDLTIYGLYFVNLESVQFGGGVEGAIVSYTETELVVKVPEGAETGKITVVAVAGSAESSQIFRDARGVILNFDNKTPCWGTMPIINASTNPDPAPISGNYARITDSDIPEQSWWNDAWVFAICGSVGVTSGVPSDYILKFEANVLEDWEYGWFEIKIVSGEEYFYVWQPHAGLEEPFTTDGWITVSVPIPSFTQKVGGAVGGPAISNIVNGADLYVAFQNPAGGVVKLLDICFDNIRIVPVSE